MKPVHVRIYYPADPLGVVPGGIDTFIRGIIKSAPPGLRFSLVGMTTDRKARPVGRWTRCQLGGNEFDFYPLVAVADAGRRGAVPLSVRYTLALGRARRRLASDADVLDFHRIEPAMVLVDDPRPKNAFFHQDPQVLRNAGADILWKRFPDLYERLESRLVPGFASNWCVRESGVETLQKRYPEQVEQIRFVPTWVDELVFGPVEGERRLQVRARLQRKFKLDPDALRIATVGRLDTQKDPMLLLGAVARLRDEGRRVELLVVGDGALRGDMEAMARQWGLAKHVHFLGLCKPTEIANVLRGSDVFALSSAYEGMPIAMLEALSCGLPVATTDVGEVRRLVQPGVNGSIAASRSERDFAACLGEVLDHCEAWRGLPAVRATEPFLPQTVLEPVYANYRRLGEQYRGWLSGKDEVYQPRFRDTVIGVPIDAVARDRASQVMMRWALDRESRYVCFCNVHSLVVARRDPVHRRAIEQADLAAPDGAPVAWTLSRKGFRRQVRIDGPSKMWTLCRDAEMLGIPIGLYGSTDETLDRLVAKLQEAFPALQIAYRYAPPFRKLDPVEDEIVCQEINASGVGFLFVGLGCPKQEAWMAEHRGRVQAVMLGVGAAFDFHAGLISRAPEWVQQHGLEWLHRLMSEPRRLWRRYLTSNSDFLLRSARRMVRPTPPAAHVERPERRRASGVQRYPGVERRRTPGDLHVSQMNDLRLQIDGIVPLNGHGRVVGFIASSEGEGTTTLARSYVRAVAEHTQRNVLLLAESGLPGDGVLHALASPDGKLGAVRKTTQGWWLGSLFGEGDADPAGGEEALRREESWAALRRTFDEIVIDMPAASRSRAGLVMAPQCDGVVVVLEAGRTRGPVAESLVSELMAVRAKPLGVVLNKRRFHLPQALYRWL